MQILGARMNGRLSVEPSGANVAEVLVPEAEECTDNSGHLLGGLAEATEREHAAKRPCESLQKYCHLPVDITYVLLCSLPKIVGGCSVLPLGSP